MNLGTPGLDGGRPAPRKWSLKRVGAGILDALIGTM